MKKLVLLLVASLLLVRHVSTAQTTPTAGREHLLMDFGWRFAYGHPFDPKQDFNNGTGHFSYFTKAGYGDGAAAAGFDDRAWRQLDLPHDWAVEQPFDVKASFSHGFKTVGRAFPQSSVGWYRKTFNVPATDLGRRLVLEFDGVFRNSIVWINGHYLGTELSGYNGFRYDLTDYLNYGGDNVIAVRVDVTMEEGWFYEGAGIYRHVWLTKTNPLHVAANGTSVTTEVANTTATVRAKASIVNEEKTAKTFSVLQTIVDAQGRTVTSQRQDNIEVKPFQTQEVALTLPVTQAHLWDLDSPYLYQLRTTVLTGSQEVDAYKTTFGIRTIRFDAKEGFFLNGKAVKLKGTNNHQDHAGVGTALPDGLQYFRIKALKDMGSNAYRCSHHPPTPELLEACDQLGMLVLDENRLMGTNFQMTEDLKGMILRDRNHPSVISWSIGNEEWGIENSITGARIATTMQAYAKSLDPTRTTTAGISGGFGSGISDVLEVMGYNYMGNGNIEAHHQRFPEQPGMGTEEGSTFATRGVYVTDAEKHYAAAYDQKPRPTFYSIEEGWNFYANRPYLAGMFIWTGFDYRGEPTPYGWPSVTSYFGMMDVCGFPKDNVYYLRSWWGQQPTLHLLPHWNWPGREGQPIEVWAYSNCDEVELFLNKKSQGRQPMPRNGHLVWKVPYAPGTLEAVGYRAGKKTLTDVVKTAGPAAALQLAADQTTLRANREDISVITVRVQDKNQQLMPTANPDITFQLSGPGKILGVGNGDPTSLEADKFLETIQIVPIGKLQEKPAESLTPPADLTASTNDDGGWAAAFSSRPADAMPTTPLPKAYVYRTSLEVPTLDPAATVTFFYRSMGPEQSVYLNGKPLAENLKDSKAGTVFKLDRTLLKAGRNDLVVVATPFVKKHSWDSYNTDPGLLQIVTPPAPWHRRAFNGLAQIIVQTTQAPGNLVLTAKAPGLKPATLTLPAKAAPARPSVP